MRYLSSKIPGLVKELPAETLQEVQNHLATIFPSGIKSANTYGEIQEALLSFRNKEGKRLLLNQLAPIYLSLCWGDPII